MFFTHISTEQASAVTDLLLGLGGIWGGVRILSWQSIPHPHKVFWGSSYILIATGAFIGAFIHGTTYGSMGGLLWIPLMLTIFVALGLFSIASLYEFYTYTPPLFLLLFTGILIVAGCMSVFFMEEFFQVFIIYELSFFCVLSILFLYLGTKHKNPGYLQIFLDKPIHTVNLHAYILPRPGSRHYVGVNA